MNYIDEIAAAIRRRVPAESLPHNNELQELFRLYALLALTKGTGVGAEDIHNAWAAWMAGQDPDHESLRPFSQLDSSTRRKDLPFVEAIRATAAEVGEEQVGS